MSDKAKIDPITNEEARILRGIAAMRNGIAWITDLRDLVDERRKDPRWHGIVPTLVKRRLLKCDAVMGMFPTWCVTKKGSTALMAHDFQVSAEAVKP